MVTAAKQRGSPIGQGTLPGLPRARVPATVVRLLETNLARIGNTEYARANDSFGLITLRNRHVRIQGGRLAFDFRGKHGTRHSIDLRYRLLASIVRGGDFTCTKVRGQRETVATPSVDQPISGYVTMLQFVNCCTVTEPELRGGIVTGIPRNGADSFFIDHGQLAAGRIASVIYYTTQSPAGVPPRDLHRTGATYHPSNPASVSPVFQWVIFRNRPAKGHLIASLNQGDTFNYPRQSGGTAASSV